MATPALQPSPGNPSVESNSRVERVPSGAATPSDSGSALSCVHELVCDLPMRWRVGAVAAGGYVAAYLAAFHRAASRRLVAAHDQPAVACLAGAWHAPDEGSRGAQGACFLAVTALLWPLSSELS